MTEAPDANDQVAAGIPDGIMSERPPGASDKTEIGPTPAVESGENSRGERTYLFRGDDNYRGGPVGRVFGVEADSADIQNFADHVLRKQSNRSSRYTSFTTEVKIARRFTSAKDNRFIRKAETARLRELESLGIVKIWTSELVYETLAQGPRKLAKQAADVRAAMRRNRELLVEGQIPEGVMQPAH